MKPTRLMLLAVFVILFLNGCSRNRPTPTPATTPMTTAQTATLQVNVRPDGATVWINGEARGQTPLTLAVPAGDVAVRVGKAGYATLEQTITLAAGREGMLTDTLADLAAPQIDIALSAERITPEDILTITAHATDNERVSRLEIWLDDRLLADSVEPTLSVAWQPDAVGDHRLRVRATDGIGNVAEAERLVQVVAAPTPTAAPTSATAIPPATPVSVTVTSVSIPTYPYRAFQQPRQNTDLNFAYFYFDRAAYEASNPTPAPQDYELVVMENEWLRLTFLPGLGGRLYEAIFKPTGNNAFYRNPVIKPSVWGPPEGNAGWLAAGGLEWAFPVIEHGYQWAVPWGFITLPGEAAATVTLFDGARDNRLRVSVNVTLAPGEARFTVQPRIENPTGAPLRFHFWLTALLAPGAANRPSPDLRFVLPVDEMTVHTTTDPTLPEPMQALAWPIYQGRDLSRLGNWQRYLGIFERPAAQGDFMGVYDEAADEGMVRVFPSDVARGAKAFAFGTADDNTDPSDYTNDGSGYVELHGGIAPTFWDDVTLEPGGVIQWTETWYAVAGIGGLTWADENVALHTQPVSGGLQVGLFPVSAVAGELQVTVAGTVVYQQPVALSPAAPFRQVVPLPAGAPERGPIAITLRDAAGRALLAYESEAALR